MGEDPAFRLIQGVADQHQADTIGGFITLLEKFLLVVLPEFLEVDGSLLDHC